MELEKALRIINHLFNVLPHEFIERLPRNAQAWVMHPLLLVLLSTVVLRILRGQITHEATPRGHFHQLSPQEVLLLPSTLSGLLRRPCQLLLCHVEEHVINHRRNAGDDPFVLWQFFVLARGAADFLEAIRDEYAAIFLICQHAANRVLMPKRVLRSLIRFAFRDPDPVELLSNPPRTLVFKNEPLEYLLHDFTFRRNQL
ncbi:MAG: hypothetical protein PHZ00_02035 [Candidatus Peribacteraceae bacterium]|nr:hypothetical protein [Candidatus Peribacteraceae bacterium]